MKFQQRLLVLTMLILVCCSVAQVHAQPATGDKSLSTMWIDMGLNPQLVNWFNQNARPDDIARVDHFSLIDILGQVRVGQRLVVFKSVYDVEQLMPKIGDKFDIIGYNLEHGPGNRPDEIADPVGSVMRMRELANQYGKKLAFGPDREFALNDGVAMAPFVDMFVLQVQRVQTEPDTVRDFVLPMARQLRQANPKLQISVQVRTEGDVVAIADLLDSMKAELDGISILTSPETIDVAQALGAELRQPRVSLVEPNAPTATPRPTPKPTATPVPGIFRFPAWFCAGGLMVGGVLGAGVLATAFFYVLQRDSGTRRRTRFNVRKQHG